MPSATGLAYEDHGGGEHLPPLVFLHGAGGSRLHWPPALRRLAGCRCLAVDLAGHGESPDGGESRIEDHTLRLDRWRRELRLSRAILVGHSMGSAIALTAALATPDWVAGLVLVGAGATLPVNPRLLEGTADPDRFGETVEAILRWSFGRLASPRLVEQARRRMLDAGPAVLHRDFLACSVFDVRARLRQLRLPAEVMYGSEDRMTPPSANEELARGIEGARTLPIDGAGHMVMLEKPKEIQAAIREFLQLAAARWTDAARAREAPKDMTV